MDFVGIRSGFSTWNTCFCSCRDKKNILDFCLNVRTFSSLSCLSTQYTTEQRSKPFRGGLHLGLSWVATKARTQLTKAQQKLREGQVDRHRGASFAKVADWAIFEIPLPRVRPNTPKAPRKQLCQTCSPRESRECGRESIAKVLAKDPCEQNEMPDWFRTPTVPVL